MPQTLLERIAAGDPAAVDECIACYSGLVWSLARRYLGRHADAEDAVQEVFIEIWRNAARFDPGIAAESTFITMIARRRLIDRQRRRARVMGTQSLVDEPVAPPAPPQDRIELEEHAERARSHMGRLREEERRVLEMSLLEGLTQSQIAEAARMPLGTVKTHARRGLARLREMLETDLDPTPAGGKG